MHADQTFRLMDPASQRMLGVRADITPQIARIAASRLSGAPRPLRLCYAGEVLRVRGSQLRAGRQFRQVGVELIGAGNAAMGDAEAILLAADAAGRLGIGDLSIDINTPSLAETVCDAFDVADAARQPIAAALRRKDSAALRAAGGGPGRGGARRAARGDGRRRRRARAPRRDRPCRRRRARSSTASRASSSWSPPRRPAFR